jgi:hypothetical protein
MKVNKRKTLIPRSLHPSDSLLGLGPYVEENEQKRKRKREKEENEMSSFVRSSVRPFHSFVLSFVPPLVGQRPWASALRRAHARTFPQQTLRAYTTNHRVLAPFWRTNYELRSSTWPPTFSLPQVCFVF